MPLFLALAEGISPCGGDVHPPLGGYKQNVMEHRGQNEHIAALICRNINPSSTSVNVMVIYVYYMYTLGKAVPL